MKLGKTHRHVDYEWYFVPEVFLSNGDLAGMRYKETYPKEGAYIVSHDSIKHWVPSDKVFN